MLSRPHLLLAPVLLLNSLTAGIYCRLFFTRQAREVSGTRMSSVIGNKNRIRLCIWSLLCVTAILLFPGPETVYPRVTKAEPGRHASISPSSEKDAGDIEGEAEAMAAATNEWKKLLPRIQTFWKENEDSSHVPEADVWPLIQELKRFVELFPDSPHAPQCYYVLGKAYAAVSFLPEAIAYWKIAAKHYPQSQWASEALMAILLNFEKQGKKKEIKKLYQDIVSQYSDSAAARAAWIIMALDFLTPDNVNKVARQVKMLESRNPEIYIKVPQILDLKGRIAELQGRDKDARKYWLHYLNLTGFKAQRAATLFRIAESCRRNDKTIMALKYYNILKKDYPSQPEALFAVFRLSQLKRSFRQRISSHISGLPPVTVDPHTIKLYREIIKRFPRYPLTQEVELNLMQVLLAQGKFRDAIELAQRFLDSWPGSKFTPNVIKVGDKAIDSLETGGANVQGLEKAVEYSKEFVRLHPRSPFCKPISTAAQTIWGTYIKALLNAREFARALEQAWDFEKAFPNTKAAKLAAGLSEKALIALDEDFLNRGRPLDLLNFYYNHRPLVRKMRSSRHHFMAAKAWRDLECPDAALREFFTAWDLASGFKQGGYMLSLWADTALEAGDLVTARAISGLYPDPDSPDALELAAKLAASREQWSATRRLSQRLLNGPASVRQKRQARKMLFTSAVRLGNWKQAREIWGQIEPSLKSGEKVRLLRMWGDTALKKGDYSSASEAYGIWVTIQPQAPEASWRMALVHLRMGKTSMAMEELKALTQDAEEPWAMAASRMLSNENFWNGPAGFLLDSGQAMNM